jgi:hypothetical protein
MAVLAPLEDPRGDIVDHMGTWLRDQGLPRDRYQLVVAGNGEHPDFERSVAGVLAPHDAFVEAPGASLVGLYAAAAEAARARVLVITEAHVRAEPGSLGQVAEAFAADPGLAAAMLNFRQQSNSPMAELVDQWIVDVFKEWDDAGWIRFNTTGFAIRADALAHAGGIDPRLDLWAFPYLSARLRDQGEHVGRLDQVEVEHVVEDDIGESLWASGCFASGECVKRAEDPEFCERHFGPAGIWDRRLVYRPEVAKPILAAVSSALRRNPRDASWLGRELVARLPARVAGARPRWAWEKVSARLNATLAGVDPLPRRLRWRSFVAAQDGTVAAARLEQSTRQNGLPAAPAAGILGADRLEGVIAGAHGLERNGDRSFRWTEPVSLLRIAPAEDSILRVNTAGIRGHPLDYLHGVYVGGEQLPAELVSCDSETLDVRLSARLAGAASSGVVLICRPLIPSREGSSDTRRLGMPVVEIELGSK